MKRYIALLRGINISGKNKIQMTELKRGVEQLGFSDVKTFLNSGNVIFSSDKSDTNVFSHQIEMLIKDRFGFQIPVFVISKNEVEDILEHAPVWWSNDNKEIYDNIIFIIPPIKFSDVLAEIGKPNDKFENIENFKEAIFWSFNRQNYQKTNWWSKTASSNISSKITIRTANTIKKIVTM